MATLKIKISGSPYHVYTPAQVHKLTGRSKSQINQMINRLDEDEATQLDHCFPFPHTTAEKDAKTGLKFIVGNKKLAKFLFYCKKHKIKKPK